MRDLTLFKTEGARSHLCPRHESVLDPEIHVARFSHEKSHALSTRLYSFVIDFKSAFVKTYFYDMRRAVFLFEFHEWWLFLTPVKHEKKTFSCVGNLSQDHIMNCSENIQYICNKFPNFSDNLVFNRFTFFLYKLLHNTKMVIVFNYATNIYFYICTCYNIIYQVW